MKITYFALNLFPLFSWNFCCYKNDNISLDFAQKFHCASFTHTSPDCPLACYHFHRNSFYSHEVSCVMHVIRNPLFPSPTQKKIIKTLQAAHYKFR